MLDLKLDGNWEFRSDLSGEWQTGQVPGCVHSDLLRLGLIPDPNWRTNEIDLQWIGQTAWTYRRTFSLDVSALEQAHVVLRAEGLDTLATVRINGMEIARADNMHRIWEWDAKPSLRAGKNEIEIHFDSPLPYLKEKGKIHPLEAWNEYYDIRHRGWLRKQHSNFGWDWGPVFVSCGIWRSLSLIAWSGPRLVDVRADQTHNGDGGVFLTTTAELSEKSADGSLEVEVTLDGLPIAKTMTALAQAASGSVAIPIPDPQLWWPAGLGRQPLYQVCIRLLDGHGIELDSWARKIGLRTLPLVRKPDAWGESFHFEANGIPFFAKGANWVNPLPYPEWPADGSWQQLLRDAVLANHNMIRIWGGAYFCPDEFYDLCDEIGLTVWQDFLYACGPYPAFDTAFLANIDAEARDNIRRIRHHPSLALWCGNNELEGAFNGEKWTNMKMSFEDYDKIFNGILKSAVEELDPQGNYWPASPLCTAKDRTAVAEEAGDAHVWEAWFTDAPFENLRNHKNRFASEFGFQSMPALKTIESFTLPEDRQLNSPVLEHHQRSAPGNVQQLKTMLGWFRFPATFADQLTLTQLVQANCVKIGVEHWRRSMPRGMGTLYWQLNDCWPCPSWSSIDFAGRWKALHYFSARFFAPVLISGLEDAGKETVEVHLTNDHRHAVPGTAKWRVLNLEGTILLEDQVEAPGPGLANSLLTVIDLNKIIPACPGNGLLVQLEFHARDGTRASNLVLMERPKKLELKDPGLTSGINPNADGSFEIVVSAQHPALWVWLETDEFDLRLSDNFTPVFPGQPWKVIARPFESVSADRLRSTLKLRHVRQTY
jgi:beta-mannosidase